MAGEMASITQDGIDSDGESWALHAAVAKAVSGELRPFDKYQGPYIRSPKGTLWLYSDDGYVAYVWNESTDKTSDPFPMWGKAAEEYAAYAALSVI